MILVLSPKRLFLKKELMQIFETETGMKVRSKVFQMRLKVKVTMTNFVEVVKVPIYLNADVLVVRV